MAKSVHHCRIDCSNPTEVLQHLQSKSDHLYRFWVNYNELYNKCKSMSIEISQLKVQLSEAARAPQPAPTVPTITTIPNESDRLRIAELQTENARLREQIARLKDKQKTVAEQRINEMSASYEREQQRMKQLLLDKDHIIKTKENQVLRLRSEAEQYSEAETRQKQRFEDERRKAESDRRKWDEQRRKWQDDRLRVDSQLSELKRQLNRPKTPTTTTAITTGPSLQELEQLRAEIRKRDDQIRKRDDEIHTLRITIRNNEHRYQENLRAQLESARKEIKAEFQGLVAKLRDGCMSITTVVETYQTSRVS